LTSCVINGCVTGSLGIFLQNLIIFSPNLAVLSSKSYLLIFIISLNGHYLGQLG